MEGSYMSSKVEKKILLTDILLSLKKGILYEDAYVLYLGSLYS